MKHMRIKNGSGQNGGAAAFAVCSAFLLLGAAAGCFSGSYAGDSGAVWSGTGRSFGEYLGSNLLAVGAALLLGSSCIGFFLLPLLTAAAGFASGFAMTAALLICGSWSGAFGRCGWFIAIALPVFTVLCASAMRCSAAALGLMAFGTRPKPDTVSAFLKILMLSAGLAILLAVAASAV